MKMNKKGITLVEVIVVLIIMAVLAGILVASYTGYIDKANKDKAEIEARAVYLAVVSAYHEEYAKNPKEIGADTVKSEATKLCGITITEVEITDGNTNDDTLKSITFTASNGETCKFTFSDGVDGSWKIGS